MNPLPCACMCMWMRLLDRRSMDNNRHLIHYTCPPHTHTHKQACVDLQNRVWEQLGGDDVDPYALDWYVHTLIDVLVDTRLHADRP